MSDKKNVNLADLQEQNAEDVKGGGATLATTSFASININSPAIASINASRLTNNAMNQAMIDKINQAASTVMCPW